MCSANEVLGDAVYTDIVTYINHVPIQSHNFNGKTLIAAEDLTHFGFDVKWNEYKRTLTITRNESDIIDIPFVTCPADYEIGKKEFAITTTDVEVYTGTYKYSSYGGIDGYTLIDVNDLCCFDNVTVAWVPEVRAVKIWIEDGLEMYSKMIRPVPKFTYYEHYDAPEYSYYWNWIDLDSLFYMRFYMKTETGYYVNNDRGILTITDVIDADGNSILKSPVSSTKGTSYLPYRFNTSNEYLCLNLLLTSENLYPKKALENGGIIKFSYKENGYTNTVSDSIRVEQLPYEN
jgi:hypothetical protein